MDGNPDSDLAETLAEAGRRFGQAMTDALERMRPALDALTDLANRPEVRAVVERAERAARRRPCLCACGRAHPDDRGVCEVLDAVITRPPGSAWVGDWLGDWAVPVCAPCAAARAAREFAG
jgi:hypothetical protein